MPNDRSKDRPKDLPPATLYQALEEDALHSYARRLQELKAMQGSLALFDAIAPILRSKGLLPHPSKLSWSSYGRSIDVSAALNADALALLHAALLELGFKESDRLDYPTFASVLLKKGRLRLRLHLDTKRSGLGMKAPA